MKAVIMFYLLLALVSGVVLKLGSPKDEAKGSNWIHGDGYWTEA